MRCSLNSGGFREAGNPLNSLARTALVEGRIMFHSIKIVSALTLLFLAIAGCKPADPDSAAPTTKPITAANPLATPSKAALEKAIRIDAGSTREFVDADGYTWRPDGGFSGGGMVDRGNIQIANTKNPDNYRTEHWGMNQFSKPVPNGHYTVMLHF